MLHNKRSMLPFFLVLEIYMYCVCVYIYIYIKWNKVLKKRIWKNQKKVLNTSQHSRIKPKINIVRFLFFLLPQKDCLKLIVMGKPKKGKFILGYIVRLF